MPARRDGRYYVCAYETFLGLWWPPREVRVLEFDPHRDFYREQRQAQQAEQSDAKDAGAPVADNQNSLTVGPRGPTLLQDYVLLEKLAHQNRERIPERVVHAKGWGAFGTLTITGDIRK